MFQRKGLRVLLVEDSADDQALLLATLQQEYSELRHRCVDTAADLRAALQQESWDVLLCDHNLPGLDAPAALRIAQEEHSEIPFIIVSGLIDEELAVSAMMAGAADTISKDKLSRLLPAVERELQKSAAMQELKLARQQISRIGYYDTLTGLPNREFMLRKVNQMLQYVPPPEHFALLLLNINRFLQIPRSLGQEAANQTLRTIGGRISEGIGEAGLVARLGGDRFAVLISALTSREALRQQVDAIHQKLSEVLIIGGQELFLTCSMGVSLYPEDGGDCHGLYTSAETAMNLARSEGERCRFYERGMNASGPEQLVLEHALHRAIQREEFLLHYQPQFELGSGRMVGVEALLRWQLPGGELVPPDKFIPLLEETGLIIPVGEWVLRKACEQNRAWQQAGMPAVVVAVNLSAIQFRQMDLIPMVRRVLQQSGLEPRYLELEITENIAMHHEESIIATLTQLRAMGVSLAIDDFGTGYSSLSYLKRFPVHKLKIDRSFVSDIGEQESDGALVRTIISMAHNLGLRVIAEGVESAAQAHFLALSGCEEVQGYLYSRPLAAEAIASWPVAGSELRAMPQVHDDGEVAGSLNLSPFARPATA